MLNKKVVVIESINDLVSKKKAFAFSESPRFHHLQIYHFYPVNIPEHEISEESRKSMLDEYYIWESQGYPLAFNDLLKRIEDFVANIQPDYILLHLGCVFSKYPDLFLNILTIIKKKYPTIKFGYQRYINLIINPLGYKNDLSDLNEMNIFDNTDDLIEIEKLIFDY